MSSECEVRDEGGGVSRAEARVREPQVEIQKRGSDVKVACSSGRRTANGERGQDGRNSCSGLLSEWAWAQGW